MTTLTKRNNGTFPSLFSDFFNTNRFFETSIAEQNLFKSIPSVNIVENDNTYRIELAAPGMTKTDFKVNVEKNILTISAEKKSESKQKSERYTRQEFSYTSFSRSFQLPEEAQDNAITGKYEGGILKLNVPKKAGAKKTPPKEIKIS
jgi:HSP20 family protein